MIVYFIAVAVLVFMCCVRFLPNHYGLCLLEE